MASLTQPQSQAGVMSFYDAPARGPPINLKFVLVMIVLFALIIIVLDKFVVA